MGNAGRPRASVRPKRSVALPRSQRFLELMDGTLKPEDLTDEEIFRGQLMDKNGSFSARPPELIPREMYVAMSRELRARLRAKFEQAAPEAVDTILDVMRNGEGEQFSQFERAGTKRLDAAKYVLDRVLGPMGKEIDTKPTEELTPWQQHQAPTAGLVIDIEPDEDDAHLITSVQERRRPIRRKVVEGQVVD